MTLRTKRYAVAVLYHGVVLSVLGAVFAIADAAGSEEATEAATLILALHAFTFRRIPVSEAVERWVIEAEACPTCGHRIELEDWWRCPCGYRAATPRHAFLPCSVCGRVFAYLECPDCLAHIRI